MATIDTVQRTPTLQRVESIPPSATVRHVDQLDEPTLERFLELLESDRSTSEPPAGLEDGEIIVFTDCYRVTVA